MLTDNYQGRLKHMEYYLSNLLLFRKLFYAQANNSHVWCGFIVPFSLFYRLHTRWDKRYIFNRVRYLLKLKVKGGSRVKKHVDLIWKILSIVVVSPLFMKCQNFTLSRYYRRLNVLALWLFYSNLRGHFWHFLYFFWL